MPATKRLDIIPRGRQLVGGVRKTRLELRKERELKRNLEIYLTEANGQQSSSLLVPPPQISEIKRVVSTIFPSGKVKIEYSPKIRQILAQQVINHLYNIFVKCFLVAASAKGKYGRRIVRQEDLEYVLAGMNEKYLTLG